jgi:hypothetical protein
VKRAEPNVQNIPIWNTARNVQKLVTPVLPSAEAWQLNFEKSSSTPGCFFYPPVKLRGKWLCCCPCKLLSGYDFQLVKKVESIKEVLICSHYLLMIMKGAKTSIF